MKRLIKANNESEENVIQDILQKNKDNYDETVDKINNFIEQIVEGYDEEILDDDLAMQLLDEFSQNQNMNLEKEIDELSTEITSAKSAAVMDKKKDFEKNALTEQAIIKVPTKYSRCIYFDGVPYSQELYLTGNNNDGVKNRDDYVDKALSIFNEFGGYNCNDTNGGWIESDGTVVNEKCTTIDAKCSKIKLKENKDKIIAFAKDMVENLCQDSIYYEFSGHADFAIGTHKVCSVNINNYSENESEFAKGKKRQVTDKFVKDWCGM